jgi:hypothetical protein
VNPRVKSVKPELDYHLRLTFENGEVRLFDMKPYLSIGVFRKLKAPLAFREVHASLGSVQWRGGQDLCPDTLYEESVPASREKSAVVVREKQAAYQVKTKKIRSRR